MRPVSAQDILIEDEVQDMQKTFPLPDGSSRNDADYCSGSKNNELMDKHYLLVSTMDGKIKALDVKNNGKVLWIMDTDHSPLLEGTLNSYQLMYEGHPAVLVPSLDGSLYMYTVDSNALKPLRMNADISSMIGDDAVAGGSIVSTTGVDPITGKEKYSCSSLNCEKRKGSDCSFHTLVIRRNTQTVRAANPATGSERWNLSVAEYALSLISSDPVFKYVPNEPTANIAVRLRPPDGVVMALNNCGRTLWEVDLESPIARAWQMFNGHLEEVSLFDSENLMLVESPSGRFTDNSGLPKYEAAFYFGTVNAEPYIIPSETVRTEMQRFNMPRDSAYHATHGVDFTHPRALFLNDLALSSFLRRSYENTMNVHGIENENYFDSTKQQDACPYTDAQPLAHSTELQQVGLGNENRAGDLGWYVFKPLSDLKRKSSSSINGRVLPMKSLNANDRCDEDSFYNYNSIELLVQNLYY
ncbi:hypothetical protein AB6A40_003613 [Gnathostoma spinigerum]|uniref:Uncharacterized protein n=1 Tax=Gnathostoma spinigerum TaxID=75299 RepID=A0ABD6EA26_9BILA